MTISEKQDRLKELTRIKTCFKDYVVEQMTKIKDEIKALTDDYNPREDSEDPTYLSNDETSTDLGSEDSFSDEI